MIINKIRRPKTPLASCQEGYGHVGVGRSSLGLPTNENSASRAADPVTRPGSAANRNSRVPGSCIQQPGRGQRPIGIHRSLEIGLEPAGQTGVPQWSILKPSCSHSIKSISNFGPIKIQERQFDLDHPEFRGVYKPSQPSIQQDSAHRLRRDSFSGSGLSSPALQRSHRDSFSESPPGQLNKETSLTDSHREARIAGGSRPGIVYPLPRAARPDTRLEVDAAPPEAAALSHAEWPPTVLDIPETERLESPRCPDSSQKRGSSSPRRHTRKRPRNRSSGVYRPKKRSPHRGHWCE